MRTINSPGVQITEKDLSLRLNSPVGTNVLVPGFANQGPVSEPILITSSSELEAIYGLPTNAAERYFHYTCKEILNSPGILTTVRLPYGPDAGTAFANSYSGVFYPMANGYNATLSANEWKIGTPQHRTFSSADYNALLQGNFDWLDTSTGATYDTTTPGITSINEIGDANGFPSEINDQGDTKILQEVTAGFFILNDLQTSINETGEGYYVAFADNSAVYTSDIHGDLASPNFDSVKIAYTMVGPNSIDNIETDRMDFAIQSTKDESDKGVHSISEMLEKVGFAAFETPLFQDHLSLGVFRIRRSTSDPTMLTIGTSEKYLGSFDHNRKTVSPTGGLLKNSFIEEAVNATSPTIKMFVNPKVSRDFDWTYNKSKVPTARITVGEAAKCLFPIGIYSPDTRSVEANKEIGSVPKKLERSLRTSESVENNTVDVVVDGGLSTIFAATYGANLPKAYDDERFVNYTAATLENAQQSWMSVAIPLINFAENTRKDCVAVIDPPRYLFVKGKDAKVIEQENSNFTLDIFEPLKKIASLDSNYATMYANWIKLYDGYSGRRFWCPFSGYAASCFARNDAVAQPWSAPAGLNRGTFNCLDIAINPNQKQRDRFYELSVNPVCFFTGDGHVIMGQKTLQVKPTAFDRLNVRRLFLTLERSVSRTLKYFVFEPNTEFTRTRIVNTITPIFEFAKNTQGLYDYLIVADTRNNTPDTIDNNELIVDIYLKPVRTAEFILVNFIATRTSQNFSELL